VSLLENVPNMTNPELNGLARNRYIPEDIQLAIVDHPYRLAKEHLSWNRGLTAQVAEKLWNRKGFVLKCNLVSQGFYTDQPDRYRELYTTYGKRMMKGSMWRFNGVFLDSHYYRERTGPVACPSDVIDTICDDFIANRESYNSNQSFAYSQYFYKNTLKKIVEHKNCSLETAVKVSTSEVPEIRRAAFEKISELS
jgi:hypothetical protein